MNLKPLVYACGLGTLKLKPQWNICMCSYNNNNYRLSCFAGYEYKSHWHCNKINARGHKPSQILPNVDFCNGCNYLHHHPIKLSKHG